MNIKTRAAIVWPITWTMLKLFQIGMFLINVARYSWWTSPLWMPAVFYFFCFQSINFIYNCTVGSFIFWELPRTFFFTDRLESHKYSTARNSTPESKELALYYCSRLGEYHEDHCA